MDYVLAPLDIVALVVTAGSFYRRAWRAARWLLVWLIAAELVALAAVLHLGGYATAQLLLLASLLGWLAFTYWDFRWGLVLYLQNNLVQSFLLGLTLLLIWGGLFAELGVPDLIWHEDVVPRLLSAASAVLLLGLFGVNAYYLRSPDVSVPMSEIEDFYHEKVVHPRIARLGSPREYLDKRVPMHPLACYLWVAQLPFLTLLALPALFPGLFSDVPRPMPVDDLGAYLRGLGIWMAGLALGILAVKLALWVGDRIEDYANPFADATGKAASAAGRSLRDAWRGARGWVDWICRAVVALWDRLMGRPAAGGAAAPAVVAAAIGGHGELCRRLMGRPVAGEQARALFLFVTVVAAFFVGLNGLHILQPEAVPPAVAMFSLMALLVMLDGLSRAVLPAEYWYWRFPTAVVVVLCIALANRATDKLQFENMAYDGGSRTDLRERVARAYLPGPGSAARLEAEADGLVDDEEARRGWLERATAAAGGRRPKLVVICCSGGGVRSLVWTTTVLDRIGQTIPGFDEGVRLIAAGSAGAVGSCYYVKARYDRLPESRTPPLADGRRLDESRGWSLRVPSDNESEVVRSIALDEVWRMFDPRPVYGAPPDDRGRVLERYWDQLRQVPLEELRPAERAGRVPSLILTPTTLEDGRRLFISNLDLAPRRPTAALVAAGPAGLLAAPVRGLPLSGGSELLFGHDAWRAARGDPGLVGLVDELESGRDLYDRWVAPDGSAPASFPPTGWRGVGGARDVAQTNYSLTGVEFSRAFDRANGFRLSTAARMSATVPMVTPAVYLPSYPELRVADSGFYDNYGVDVAAAWLFRNRAWLRQHTSGVLLVQLRAIGRREVRTGVVPTPSGFFAQFFKGFQLIGSLIDGAGHSFSTQSIFRDDRQIAWLAEEFNGRGHVDPFFTTVVFESTAIIRGEPGGASPTTAGASFGALSWRLTQADARSIRAVFPEAPLVVGPANVARRAAMPGRPPASDVEQIEVAIRNQESAIDHAAPDRRASEEEVRAWLTWELERRVNRERLLALACWWQQDHAPAKDGRGEAAGP